MNRKPPAPPGNSLVLPPPFSRSICFNASPSSVPSTEPLSASSVSTFSTVTVLGAMFISTSS
jgi:hypothetical protein